MFNVLLFNASWSTRGLVKFINLLVDALNEKHRLPKYILVLLDVDVIKSVKDIRINSKEDEQPHDCLSVAIGGCLHYITKQYDQLINRQIHDLTNKKMGASLQYVVKNAALTTKQDNNNNNNNNNNLFFSFCIHCTSYINI